MGGARSDGRAREGRLRRSAGTRRQAEIHGDVMIELALFASTFVAVFALGVQSLNVNRGHDLAAFLTSFVIGGGNLVLFKLVPGDASPAQFKKLLDKASPSAKKTPKK